MQPKITPEGQKAKDSIAQARANLNAGGKRQGATIAPVVSANELTQPTTPVNPPAPVVNTNDGSRLTSLIGTTAENNQGVIQSRSENAQKEAELASLLGSQGNVDGMGMFNQLKSGTTIDADTARRKDLQNQIAAINNKAGMVKLEATAGGAGALQAERALTLADKQANLKAAGMAAEVAVLDNAIETASGLISQAMDFYYQDRQLNNQNLINQLNYYSGKAEGETKQMIDNKIREHEQDQIDVARAVNSVNAAVATGIASSKDVETMTSLAGNPQAQKEYADKIIATSARQQYQMKLAEINNARVAAQQTATSEAQGTAKANAVSTQETVNTIKSIRDNPLGIKAITGAFGLGRTSLSAGFDAAKQGFIGGTAAGALGGSVVPGLGTIAGGALGGVTGFLGGLGIGTTAAANQRVNVASDLSYLVNEATFAEMRRLKQQGVTFGSLTEGERIAIGRAADNLFSSLDVSPDGTVNGVRLTEEKFYKILDDYEQKRLVYQEELNRMASGMTTEDYQAIENAGN